MSFDVNVLRIKPIIREAASMNNDGGSGGNLGYMQQEHDEGKNKQKRLDESIFGKKEEDLFISKSEINYVEENFSIIEWGKNILQKLVQITTSHKNP